MADIFYEESCPCGSTLKTSGYRSYVDPHVISWHSTHNRHMNAIAKALAAAKEQTVANTPESQGPLQASAE